MRKARILKKKPILTFPECYCFEKTSFKAGFLAVILFPGKDKLIKYMNKYASLLKKAFIFSKIPGL